MLLRGVHSRPDIHIPPRICRHRSSEANKGGLPAPAEQFQVNYKPSDISYC
jgi:hypothetical protein